MTERTSDGTPPDADSALDPVVRAPHSPSTREETSSASSDGRAAALDAAPSKTPMAPHDFQSNGYASHCVRCHVPEYSPEAEWLDGMCEVTPVAPSDGGAVSPAAINGLDSVHLPQDGGDVSRPQLEHVLHLVTLIRAEAASIEGTEDTTQAAANILDYCHRITALDPSDGPPQRTSLSDEILDSLRSGYLFGNHDEPLDAASRRVLRVIQQRLT